MFRNRLRYRHVADALAGQGQGFAVGVAHQGVIVQIGQIGRFFPVEHQLPVGLVRDEVDGTAVFLLLLPEQAGQLLQHLPGQHHAAGIVGGIDDEGPRIASEPAFQGRQVHLQVLPFRRHDHRFRAGSLHEDLVFREKGRQQHHLIPGQAHGLQADGQGGRGAAGQIEVVRADLGPEAALQGVGHGLPHPGVAGGGGIAVQQQGIRRILQAGDGLLHLRRRGHAGVAQTEIEHLVRADLGGAHLAVLKYLADDRTVPAQPQHGLVEHEKPPPGVSALFGSVFIVYIMMILNYNTGPAY